MEALEVWRLEAWRLEAEAGGGCRLAEGSRLEAGGAGSWSSPGRMAERKPSLGWPGFGYNRWPFQVLQGVGLSGTPVQRVGRFRYSRDFAV